MTLVEVMVAVTVLLVAMLGTSAYHYSAALNARRGNIYATASRTALLLSEGWNGVFGATNFNPVTAFGEQLTFTNSEGPEQPGGFTLLGKYRIEIDDVGYYATLSYKNIASELRALNIIISWDHSAKGDEAFGSVSKSYELTVYVENPA